MAIFTIEELGRAGIPGRPIFGRTKMPKKLTLKKHVWMGRVDYEPKCETSQKLLGLLKDRKSFQEKHVQIIKDAFPDIVIELV